MLPLSSPLLSLRSATISTTTFHSVLKLVTSSSTRLQACFLLILFLGTITTRYHHPALEPAPFPYHLSKSNIKKKFGDLVPIPICLPVLHKAATISLPPVNIKLLKKKSNWRLGSHAHLCATSCNIFNFFNSINWRLGFHAHLLALLFISLTYNPLLTLMVVV